MSVGELWRLLRGGIDPYQLLLAEEMRVLISDVKLGKVEVEKKRTRFVSVINGRVNGSYVLLRVEGAGELDSLTVICDSEFGVNINIDGDLRAYSWSDLQVISEDVEDLAVFQNDLGYVLVLKNLSFVSFFEFRVVGDCTIVRAFGKYEVYE